jgi:L,D-transpeptidase catalytic domain
MGKQNSASLTVNEIMFYIGALALALLVSTRTHASTSIADIAEPTKAVFSDLSSVEIPEPPTRPESFPESSPAKESANSSNTQLPAAAQKLPVRQAENVVGSRPVVRALTYFEKNLESFANHTYIAVADFTRSALEKRLFLINLKTGQVAAFPVAHGRGSDPAHSNKPKKFSNTLGSNATSLGFYRTGEIFIGEHGRSLKLDGLSATNSNARSRDIIVHSAPYVNSQEAFGRSNGCLAVDEKTRNILLAKLGSGAMIYAYGGQ